MDWYWTSITAIFGFTFWTRVLTQMKLIACIGHTYLRLLIFNFNLSNVHLCCCDPTRMCALTYPTRRHVANSLGSMWPLQTLRSIKTTRTYLFADVSQLKQNKQCSIVSLSKRRHPKIGRTNFGGILHHSARERKQKTLKILCFVICVEDYHKLIDRNTVFNPVPPRQSDVHVDQNVACLSSLTRDWLE
jgi:hypothetical protein